MDTQLREQALSFYCPIRLEVHPGGDEINRRATAWMVDQGFCEDKAAESKLGHADIGGLVARLFPGASEIALETIAKYYLWGFAFDDAVERRAAIRLTDAVDAHGDIMRVLDAPLSAVQVTSPYGRAFREISDMFQSLATPEIWRRWIDSNRAFALGVVWGCAYRSSRTIPSPDHVTTIRALEAGGGSYGTSLVELAWGCEVPAEAWERAEVTALTDMTSALLAWDNDIYSYAVEIDKQVEEINLVTSLAHHWSLSPHESITQAVNMRNRVMWCYQRLRRRRLGGDDEALELYLTGLDQLIRGHLDWALTRTSRYDSEPVEPIALTLTEEAPRHADGFAQPVELPTLRWWWDLL